MKKHIAKKINIFNHTKIPKIQLQVKKLIKTHKI